MASKPVSLDVIWAQEWKSWGVIGYDAEGNQVGEGAWVPTLVAAEYTAQDFMTRNPQVHTTNYYTRAGKLRKKEDRSVVPTWFDMSGYPRTDDTRVPKGASAKQAISYLITHLEALNRLQVRDTHHEYEVYADRRNNVQLAILHFLDTAIDAHANGRIMDGFDHYC
jgi:hypothetical protein